MFSVSHTRRSLAKDTLLDRLVSRSKYSAELHATQPPMAAIPYLSNPTTKYTSMTSNLLSFRYQFYSFSIDAPLSFPGLLHRHQVRSRIPSTSFTNSLTTYLPYPE